MRDLIKNYKKFPEVIPKLSFVNRQDLLYVIGKTDVLFRSTLNFSYANSIKSHTIYRQTGLTVGSDRYKSENLSTQVPDSTTYRALGDQKESPQFSKSKGSSKKSFGVIPTKLIKELESNNSYDDRINALNEIYQVYVKDQTNFIILRKRLLDFVLLLLKLASEEDLTEDESIGYECLRLVHSIFELNQNFQAKRQILAKQNSR